MRKNTVILLTFIMILGLCACGAEEPQNPEPADEAAPEVVPPVMVTVLLILLYYNKRELFPNASDMAVMIVMLSLFPVMAYPMQRIVPKWSKYGITTVQNTSVIDGYCILTRCSQRTPL